MVVELPDSFTSEVRDLIERFLRRDVCDRLGCQGRGAAEVKEHPFFSGRLAHASPGTSSGSGSAPASAQSSSPLLPSSASPCGSSSAGGVGPGVDWQLVYLHKYPPPLVPPRGEVNAADAFDIGNFDEEDTKGIKVLLNPHIYRTIRIYSMYINFMRTIFQRR